MGVIQETALIICGVFALVTSVVWYVMKILDTLQRIATALEGFTVEKEDAAPVAIDGEIFAGRSTKEKVGGSQRMGFRRDA